jgi:hypothetical protein
MKRLLLILTLLFVSLNFIACAAKKDNRTRLSKGTRTNVTNTATSPGWNILNQQSTLDVLTPPQGKTPYQVAIDFIGGDTDLSQYNNINGVQLRIVRTNIHQSMMVLRFYDDQYYPVSYYIGQESGAVVREGYVNGNQVNVVFNDGYGDIRVVGQIYGSQFQGEIWDGNVSMGRFNLPVSGSIFY